MRVVVLDDNVDAAESLAMLLELWGHDVKVLHDPAQALAAARAHCAEVVFLDIGLPGIDGYELARRFRQDEELSHVLLIALTGYGLQEDRGRAEAAGFNHHFVKPVDPDVLRDLLSAEKVLR